MGIGYHNKEGASFEIGDFLKDPSIWKKRVQETAYSPRPSGQGGIYLSHIYWEEVQASDLKKLTQVQAREALYKAKHFYNNKW